MKFKMLPKIVLGILGLILIQWVYNKIGSGDQLVIFGAFLLIIYFSYFKKDKKNKAKE